MKMKKPGKKRRKVDPLVAFLAGQPIPSTQRTDLDLTMLIPFDEMKAGRGTQDHWAMLASSANVAVMLAELGVLNQEMESFKAAQDALIETRDRGEKTGKWGLSGQAMTLVSAVLELHQEQYRVATRRQVERAIKIVHERVMSGEYM